MVAGLTAVCRAAEGSFQLLPVGFGELDLGGFSLLAVLRRALKELHFALVGLDAVFRHGVFDPPVDGVFGVHAFFLQGQKAVGGLLVQEFFRDPVVPECFDAGAFFNLVPGDMVFQFLVLLTLRLR